MVHDYISKERTIVLAVISTKNGYANQVILERCREVDLKGSRTLGIITKPDSLRPGSENEKTWLDLAQNNNVYFELGWHLLKNRADDEMTPFFQERNTEERIFFSTGSYRDLPSHMTGVDALRGRLSKLLYNHLEKELPGHRGELDSTMVSTIKELELMAKREPPSRIKGCSL